MWSTPAKGLAYEAVFVAATAAYALPHGLLSRVAYQESRYNAAAQSPKGAIGLMQFLPATARDIGIDPADPHQSIWGAAKYLRDLFNRFGNWKEAIAAYNWGQGNVTRLGIAKAPQETRNYVQGVLGDIGILT
jgi:soluble lytic murein transglycosylase-like protein